MGKRTSIYLSDDLAAAVDRTGLPLAELVRRGIYGPPAKPTVVPIRQPGVPQSEAASPVVVAEPEDRVYPAAEIVVPAPPSARTLALWRLPSLAGDRFRG